MPKNTNEDQTTRTFRKELSKNLQQEGITPISYDGKFSAVLISFPDMDEKAAARLHDKLKFNPVAAINEILEN